MIQKRADTPANQTIVLECVEDIRAIAARCEQIGMLSAWATLLDVVDQMLSTIEGHPDAHIDAGDRRGTDSAH